MRKFILAVCISGRERMLDEILNFSSVDSE